MVSVKELGNCSQVAGKVTLCSFRHTFSTPANENVLWKAGVGVRYFHIGELHPSFGKFLDEVRQFTLSGALDLEDTLLTSILLEGTDKWGRD
jgi:hypothetical protein